MYLSTTQYPPPSCLQKKHVEEYVAIASRMEAITIRVEAITIRVEAIASRVEAIASR